MTHTARWLGGIVVVFFLVAIYLLIEIATIESSFYLAKSSRLPRWFEVPPGLERDNVSVRLTYHTVSGPTYTLFGPNGDIESVSGTSRLHPTLENKPGDYYPKFTIESANGVREIFMFTRMEPVFYVFDGDVMTSTLPRVE